jgi:hypothetical protein
MKTKLIITNLKDFFKHGFDRPFKILEQIENQVHRITESGNIHFGDKTKILLSNYIDNDITSVAYKSIIFKLESYEFKNDYHIFYYSFNSIA